MKHPKAETLPPLRSGSRLHLHRGGRVRKNPLAVTVDHFQDGQIQIKGASGSLAEGEVVLVEFRIDDDARYLTRGEIEARQPDRTSIVCDDEWRRVQDRSFVRISTHGLQVDVHPSTTASVPDEDEDGNLQPNTSGRFAMLDVSAGGIRFESREPFPVDQQFVFHFELPGQACYVLPADVVRSVHRPGSTLWYQVAVEFVGLDEAHRSQLLQWIYHEQARRHRSAKQGQR
ncbi:MAG: hypothetical protein GY944_00310 [bacterium]|nr:hypothetical protein [bacterium]